MFMAFCSWCWIGEKVQAQDIAVKTNALYWLTTTPNLGVEFAVGDQTTFSLEGGYNPWTLNKEENRKLKHWMVLPEFRYWLCEAFNGHFFGVNSGYTFFNISGMPIPFHSRGDPRLPLSGLGHRSWSDLRLFVDHRQASQPRAHPGRRLRLFAVRQVRVPDMRRPSRTREQPLLRTTKAGISLIYMLK